MLSRDEANADNAVLYAQEMSVITPRAFMEPACFTGPNPCSVVWAVGAVGTGTTQRGVPPTPAA